MNSTSPTASGASVGNLSAKSASVGGNGSGRPLEKSRMTAPTSPSVSASKRSPESSPQEGDSIFAFLDYVQTGILLWVKAGQILVRLVEKDKGVFDKITAECPWMTTSLLWNFYRMGRRQLYPHVLILPSNASLSRRIASLPYEMQQKVCENGLEVLDEKGNGLVKKLAHCDSRDLALAITPGGQLRTIQEQRKFRERNEDSLPAERGHPKVVSPARPMTDLNYGKPIEPCLTPLMPVVSAGAYRVELNLNTGEVRFEKHQGQFAPGWTKIMLGPNKGKLTAHFILMKPKPE